MKHTNAFLIRLVTSAVGWKLLLKLIMGFAADFPLPIIINVPQWILIPIIIRNDQNFYEGNFEADLKISKFEWKITWCRAMRLTLIYCIQKNPQIK